MSYSNFNQGDIVVADVLFSEQISAKRRPALVISNTRYNSQTEDLVLLKISSNDAMQEYDALLTNQDMTEGELKKDSKIMIDSPVTLYRELVHQKIGSVSKEKLSNVKQKMRDFYEL
jgi:mRNA-degrading endonuclease toxin of MazEF toxin-antitoxin module